MRRPARATLRSQRSRKGAVLLTVSAAASAVALSGCMMFSPVQTEKAYDPADGVSATLGQVSVYDLLVVSKAKGAPGVVSGYVRNTGSKEVTLQLAGPGGAPVKTSVPAGGTASLSPSDGPSTELKSVDVEPGSMLTLQLSTPGSGASQVSVPVLLPTEYYSTVTPSAAPTSAG